MPTFVETPPPKTFAEMQYTGAFASPSKGLDSESDDETYEIPDKVGGAELELARKTFAWTSDQTSDEISLPSSLLCR